jgi:hypothetical protein
MSEDNFGLIFPGLVESIHVELSDEAVEVAMSEVFGKDLGFEFMDVFDQELFAVGGPGDG